MPIFTEFPDVKIQMRGGIRYSWPKTQGPRAEVRYLVPWEQVFDFSNALKGVGGTGASGLIRPGPPHQFPPSPNLYLEDILTIEGEGAKKSDWSGEGGQAWNPYVQAVVACSYAVPDFAVDESTANAANQIDPAEPIIYCRQRVRASNGFLTFDGAKLKYKDSGVVIETADGVPANQVEFSLEFPRLLRNPYNFLKQYLGRTNSQTVWGFEPDHVLFRDFETDTVASSQGAECSAVLTFGCTLDVNWNQRLNDEGEPEEVVFVNSDPDRPPFQRANLREIWA